MDKDIKKPIKNNNIILHKIEIQRFQAIIAP